MGPTIRLDPGSTKNDDGRLVYVPATLELSLREQVARVQALERQLGCPVPYLFPHFKGRRAGQRRRDFRKAWQTALLRAELDGLTGEARQAREAELRELLKLPTRELRRHPRAGLLAKLRHDFRRTAVRNAVNAGVPERVAMKLTGHRTRSVFDRYHIVSPADLKEAARRIGQGPAQSPALPSGATFGVAPAARA